MLGCDDVRIMLAGGAAAVVHSSGHLNWGLASRYLVRIRVDFSSEHIYETKTAVLFHKTEP